MIDRIATEIEARLKSLGVFKAVERTVTASILKTPPSAALFLDSDRKVVDKPTATRDLHWDIVLMIPALGADKGKAMAGDCIDAVRDAFTDWQPWTTGGVLPSEVPEVRLEGVERTILVYTVRLTMRVMPEIIAKNHG